jgi:hypothetical protein
MTIRRRRFELDEAKKSGREDWLKLRDQQAGISPTLEEVRAKGRQDWLKLRQERAGRTTDPNDQSGDRGRDPEHKDLSREPDTGIDDDLK